MTKLKAKEVSFSQAKPIIALQLLRAVSDMTTGHLRVEKDRNCYFNLNEILESCGMNYNFNTARLQFLHGSPQPYRTTVNIGDLYLILRGYERKGLLTRITFFSHGDRDWGYRADTSKTREIKEKTIQLMRMYVE